MASLIDEGPEKSRIQFPLLEVEELECGYGLTPVLTRLSWRLETPGVVVLTGPNGAGKTTLLRALAGLHPTDGGNIRYRGENTTKWQRRDL